MASPPIPPSLEHLASRTFSFYPSIAGVECNDWTFEKATWSEVLVRNHKNDLELWVPRAYIGEVSSTEDPVLIVGLTRELEYKGGMLRPFQKRIIKMPSAGLADAASSVAEPGAAQPRLGLRMDRSDKSVVRLVGLALGAFILIYVLSVVGMRMGDVRQRRTVFTTTDRTFQQLTARDDRFSIVAKIGSPALDRFKEVGTIQFEALTYPDRRYIVLLMGADKQNLFYVGTVDDQWRPLHSVALKNGGTTHDLLRTIERF